MFRILLLYLLFFSFQVAFGQTPGIEQSILSRSVVYENPARIVLQVYQTHTSDSIRVLRKTRDQSTFTRIGRMPGNNTTGAMTEWADTSVRIGEQYEYQMIRSGGNANGGFAFINAGIEVPEVHKRGVLILVVDTVQTVLGELLQNYQKTVEGDGWIVKKFVTRRTDSVAAVKRRIRNLWLQDTTVNTAVFLLGAVPVPYSGAISPDGHADHHGAWPADGFYGDMHNRWTDIQNYGGNGRQKNVPGDGKYDQSTFTGRVVLQVGRVDPRELPAFNMQETALMKRYLEKNIRFRTKKFTVRSVGQLSDFATGAGLSVTAWRNYTNLVQEDTPPTPNYYTMSTGDYRTTLRTNDCLWSGAYGAGSYTSVGPLTSSNFVTDSLRTVFSTFMGSYFGDWDVSNNLMRCALFNKGPLLFAAWAGRPNYNFHHMGMGETVGYSVRLGMNSSPYQNFGYSRLISVSMLGDPTLRMHNMEQVSQVQAVFQNGKVNLSWTPPNEQVLGYHIYRKLQGEQAFERINLKLISTAEYTDTCLYGNGKMIYMVRSVKLEASKTGTYFNQSVGVMDTVQVTSNANLPIPAVSIVLKPLANTCTESKVEVEANAVHGGNAPYFIWRRNGEVIGGQNGAKISIKLNPGVNRFTVEMFSTLACVKQRIAKSNEVSSTFLGPGRVKPVVSAPVLSGPLPAELCTYRTKFPFSATVSNLGVTTKYKWFFSGADVQESDGPADTLIAVIPGNLRAQLRVVTWSVCGIKDSTHSPLSAPVGNVVESIYFNEKINYLPKEFCKNQPIVFNPDLWISQYPFPFTHNWLVNDTIKATGSNSFVYQNPKDGDKVYFTIETSRKCAFPKFYRSDTVTLAVKDSITPFVSLLLDTLPICRNYRKDFGFLTYGEGQYDKFYLYANGALVDSSIRETEIGYGYTNGFRTQPLSSNTNLQIKMISSLTCATKDTVFSDVRTVVVKDTIIPEVFISGNLSDSTLCLGDTLFFVAESNTFPDYNHDIDPVNAYSKFYWYLNGKIDTIPQGTWQIYWQIITDSLQTLQVAMASNYACAFPKLVYSKIETINKMARRNPNLILNTSPANASVCEGNPLTLIARSNEKGKNPLFSWKVNGKLVRSGADTLWKTDTLKNNDTVLVRMKSNAACLLRDTALSNTRIVKVNPVPNAAFTPMLDTLKATLQGQAQYQWLLNGNLVSGASNPVFIAQVAGNYQVIVSNTFGCSDTSAAIFVTPVEQNVPKASNGILVLPVPAQDMLMVQSDESIQQLWFTDVQGKQLKQISVNKTAKNQAEANIAELATGMYFVHIHTSKGKLCQYFLKK